MTGKKEGFKYIIPLFLTGKKPSEMFLMIQFNDPSNIYLLSKEYQGFSIS